MTSVGVAPRSSFTPFKGDTGVGADALRVVPSAAAPSPPPPIELGDETLLDSRAHATPTASAVTVQNSQNFRVMNTSLLQKNEVALKIGR
jgi:hypothetical protein